MIGRGGRWREFSITLIRQVLHHREDLANQGSFRHGVKGSS
jgi:hypothetical protein